MKTNHKIVTCLAVAALVALAQPLPRAAAALTDALTVHLTFNGNLKDSTTNGINGLSMALGTVETNGPSFVPGFIGQAVHIVCTSDNKTNDFVSLGYPPLLHFGSDATGDTTDFSISVWVRIFSSLADEPLISNKNWDSSGNQGWIIANENNGVRVTLKDDVNSKKDMNGHAGPQLEDGNWHHLAVTFQRTNNAYTYVDGVLDLAHVVFIGPDPGNPVGSLETDGLPVDRGPGWAVNLGQDGTGLYNISDTAAIDCLMDDLGIWRRALTPDEVAQIYSAGVQGLNLAQTAQASAFFKDASPAPGSLSPAIGTLSVQIQPGGVPINPQSITMTLDGQSVSPSLTNVAGVTTLSYAFGSAQALPPFSSHTVTATASDTNTPPKSITNTWSFVVVGWTAVPAAYAAAVGSANTPGMLYRAAWASAASSALPNTLDRTEAQLAGTLIDPNTGLAFKNDATNGPLSFNGLSAYYPVNVVNFNDYGTNAGDIPGDTCFPALPCGTESDSFATEVITFIELQPGYYRWGVNSASDFSLSVGNPAQDLLQSQVIGQFAESAGRSASDTTFDFQITQAGVYAFRLIYEQSSGAASEEWWSVDLSSGQQTLINDTNAAAVKAYRALTGLPQGPYVLSVTPERGQNTVPPAPAVSVQVVDGPSPLATNSLRLSLNGTAVSSLGLTKTGLVTTVTYQVPTNTPLSPGTTYTASLAYGDGTTTRTDQWAFATHPVITGGLVCHLALDGDFTDWSGQGANGSPEALGTNTPVFAPTFEAGQIGQAVHLIATSDDETNAYVSLGYPPLLRMGSDLTGDLTDFSLSFWVLINSSQNDEPLMSNMNWDSSDDFGWIVANEGGGMRVDLHDQGGSDKKDSGTFAVNTHDGNWHHIAVTFQRKGFARTYVDGVVTNVLDIAPDWGVPAGSLDTYSLKPGRGPGAFAWNLGQDGTGEYAVSDGAAIDCLMDDVGIWRRVLGDDEVANIYQLGQAGKTFAPKVAPAIRLNAPVLSGQNLVLTWTGGSPPYVLEEKASLSATNWVNVQTNSTLTATVPASGVSGFLRVAGQ